MNSLGIRLNSACVVFNLPAGDANQIHISEWTVSAHLRRIFIKLNVDSRAAMVYRCASLINRLH